MIYIIFGTNFEKREKAKDYIKNLLKKKNIDFEKLLEVPKINIDNYSLLPNYFGSISLFGERLLINIENLLTKEESREYLYKNLENMHISQNIFILDEPFALAQSFQKVERDFEKLGIRENAFDASEEKDKKDINPFYLCELIEKRDKKSAWQEWKKLYTEWGDSEAQAIHGAIWWKWKNMWTAFLDGDKNNYYRFYKLSSREINYTEKELEFFGKEISIMSMKANNGEINLMRSIERFILKI